MHELAKRYLRYVRASLADATRLLPDVSNKKLQGSDNTRSAQAVTMQIFAIAKETNDRETHDHRPPDAESLWPIRLLICPRVYAQRPEYGKLNGQLPEKVAPVFVCARLHEAGSRRRLLYACQACSRRRRC